MEPIRAGIPRLCEVILALLCLMFLAPLLLLIAIAIRISSRGPALFRQARVGRWGRTFVLYKFRTMRASVAGPYVTADDDHRITPVGRILRKTKLDELPELWNVLCGDMALVGPRPELPCYVNLQDTDWRFVLQHRPGITDPVTLQLRNEEKLLASVSGDREGFYRQILQPYKVRGYERYLLQRTFWSDLAVLFRTAIAIGFSRSTPTIGEIRAGTLPLILERAISAQENMDLASPASGGPSSTTAAQ